MIKSRLRKNIPSQDKSMPGREELEIQNYKLQIALHPYRTDTKNHSITNDFYRGTISR